MFVARPGLAVCDSHDNKYFEKHEIGVQVYNSHTAQVLRAYSILPRKPSLLHRACAEDSRSLLSESLSLSLTESLANGNTIPSLALNYQKGKSQVADKR